LNDNTDFESIIVSIGIARNILANRIKDLQRSKVLKSSKVKGDGRKRLYSLTAKGKGLSNVIEEAKKWK